MGIQQHKLTSNWRSSTCSLYESNWSKCHKFAYLNRVGATEIKQSLCVDEWKLRPQNWGRKSSQLLNQGHFNTQKLLYAFDTSEEQLKFGWIEPYYLANTLKDNIAALDLRYCPECIKNGYHSPLYQMLWLVKCPIHHEPLIQNCPACGKSLSLSLANENFQTPYGCRCKYVLWPNRDNSIWNKEFTIAQEKSIGNIVNWLHEIKKERQSKYFSCGFMMGPYVDRQPDWYHPRPIESYMHWSELISLKDNEKLLFKRENCLEQSHNIQYVKHIKSYSHYNIADPHLGALERYNLILDTERKLKDYTSLYQPIYKSIRRYLFKTFMYKHLICKKLTKKGAMFNINISNMKICPLAYAYIKWLEHWDQKKYKYHNSYNFGYTWYPPTSYAAYIGSKIMGDLLLNSLIGKTDKIHPALLWMTQHMLAATLITTFIEAVQLSYLPLNEFDEDTPKPLVSDRMMPYYIVEWCSENSIYKLHYWGRTLDGIRDLIPETLQGHNSHVRQRYKIMQDESKNNLRQIMDYYFR